MMSLSALVAALFGLISAILLGHVIMVAIKSTLAFHRFKRRAVGLKIAPGWQVFGGHFRSMAHQQHNVLNVHKQFLNDTSSTTYGWMLADRPAAITVDLDVIKFLTSNTNRLNPFNSPIAEFDVDSIGTAEGEQWKRLRRIVAPALAKNQLRRTNTLSGFELVVKNFINVLNSKITGANAMSTKGDTKPFVIINASDYCLRYTLDLVFKSLYGKSNMIDYNSIKDDYTEVVEDGVSKLFGPATSLCVISSLLRSIIVWLNAHLTPQGKFSSMLMDIIMSQSKLTRRKASTLNSMSEFVDSIDRPASKDGTLSSKENLSRYLVNHLKEAKITQNEYKHSSFFMFYAAAKTSADVLIHCVNFLARDQTRQEKLRQDIIEAGLESNYLTWCINESLRLHPPIPLGCTRTISSDYVGDKFTIPKGTTVVMTLYSLHRREDLYGSDASEFKPERFAQAHEWNPLQYMPFGGGARMCPGRDFAMIELRMVLMELLLQFKLEYKLEDNPNNDELLYNCPYFFVTAFDSPLNIRLSRLN